MFYDIYCEGVKIKKQSLATQENVLPRQLAAGEEDADVEQVYRQRHLIPFRHSFPALFAPAVAMRGLHQTYQPHIVRVEQVVDIPSRPLDMSGSIMVAQHVTYFGIAALDGIAKRHTLLLRQPCIQHFAVEFEQEGRLDIILCLSF